jgi:hypothetical protein
MLLEVPLVGISDGVLLVGSGVGTLGIAEGVSVGATEGAGSSVLAVSPVLELGAGSDVSDVADVSVVNTSLGAGCSPAVEALAVGILSGGVVLEVSPPGSGKMIPSR